MVCNWECQAFSDLLQRFWIIKMYWNCQGRSLYFSDQLQSLLQSRVQPLKSTLCGNSTLLTWAETSVCERVFNPIGIWISPWTGSLDVVFSVSTHMLSIRMVTQTGIFLPILQNSTQLAYSKSWMHQVNGVQKKKITGIYGTVQSCSGQKINSPPLTL